MEPSGVFEMFLRFAGSVSLTIAATWMWCLIRQKRMMGGGYVWPYFAGVITALAAWRWFIVSLLFPDAWPEGWLASVSQFVQPVNSALYFLLGLSVIILVFGHLTGVEAAKARRARLTDTGPYTERHHD